MKRFLVLGACWASLALGVTVKTVTVKSSGGDYTSLQGAITGEVATNADLVAGDIQLNIACYAMSDTTAADVDGFTTDATRYVRIYAPTGERHTGKWDTAKYRLEVTDAAPLHINDKYVRVDGIQVRIVLPTSGLFGIHVAAGANAGVIVLSNCIIRGGGGESGINGGIYAEYGETYIYNCIMYDMGGHANSSGISVWGTTVYVYSTTIVGSGESAGIVRWDGTAICKNTYSSGQATRAYSGTITKTTCASLDETGSAGLWNIATSVANFANVTAGSEDFRLPLGSALIDVGTDTSGESAPLNFTTDIEGQTRTGTWDVGADEYVASAVRRRIIIMALAELGLHSTRWMGRR